MSKPKIKMINCPACGRQVSSNAAACPSCAEPIRPEKTNTGAINMRDPVHIIGVLIAIAIILGIIAAMISVLHF